MSQSDKAAECKQQDMNYATRIQLQQVCEKTKEAIDTGTYRMWFHIVSIDDVQDST